MPSFNNAENLTSPIILDLDGDGVETLNKSEGVYFDHDGNLLAEKTGWVGKNDGLLVFDRNADGQISSGAELFGNQTTLTNGEKAANGFEALKDLDSNGDGVLNQSDEAWSKLQVWKDTDSNGVVDSGELLSMADVGVAAINTEYATGKTTDSSGNEHRETGSFTRTDGSEGKATDVWFKIDLARTRYVGDVELSDEVKALPNAVGFGELPDLQVAMAADKTLQALVNQYVNTEDAGERQKLLEPIIYQWAGVSDVDPYSRDPTKVYGHVMDARQLETLEKLTGTPYVGTWCWGEKDPNPHGRAAPVLIEQFNRFASFVESQLLAQSHYKNAFDAITLKYDESSESFVPDWTGFEEHLTGLLGTSDDTIVELANIARKLGSYSPELSRAVEDSLNRLSVTSPVLAALLDSKNAVGTAGNDYLTTGNGNEVLYGKGGDDRLFGGSGDDSYFFDKGDGKDRIYDSAGSDKIVFREGVNRENLEFSRNLTTVWIKLKDSEGQYTGDEIQLDNYFDFDGTLKEGAIESVELADGSVLSQADILASLVSEATEDNDLIFGTGQTDNLSGKAGDDQMYGFNGDDVIAGDAGNDTLSGDAGNDKLIGGEGNDELNGGLGNDTYLFSAGHGCDS
ncbi:calcium-binding protein [Endozoicomonas sp. GU-1]|nr:calcium-binding protein [Endozoicomonas sp. GU-1]WBA82171.1 calcium-binding protein [Endozoicomonas sp. GU-1]